MGGYSHVKAYKVVSLKWVTVSPKIPRLESHFGQKKKKLGEGPIWPKKKPNLKQNKAKRRRRRRRRKTTTTTTCQISHFLGKKNLEMGPNLPKFWKKQTNKQSNQVLLEGEKSLDRVRVSRPRAAHPIKK